MADFKLSSPAFEHGAGIPQRFTCEGQDESPPLVWSGIPANARSLALIVDDPDAPDPKAPKITFVHWVLYNLPPHDAHLEAGAAQGALSPGTQQGKNGWNRIGYGGPCPPIGRHRYFWKLYALDVKLPDLHEPTKDQLLKAMEGHVVAHTELMGTYQKEKAR